MLGCTYAKSSTKEEASLHNICDISHLHILSSPKCLNLLKFKFFTFLSSLSHESFKPSYPVVDLVPHSPAVSDTNHFGAKLMTINPHQSK